MACGRYYAICHPLRARHVHTVRRAIRLVVVFWIISLILVSPQLAVQHRGASDVGGAKDVDGTRKGRLTVVGGVRGGERSDGGGRSEKVGGARWWAGREGERARRWAGRGRLAQ